VSNIGVELEDVRGMVTAKVEAVHTLWCSANIWCSQGRGSDSRPLYLLVRHTVLHAAFFTLHGDPYLARTLLRRHGGYARRLRVRVQFWSKSLLTLSWSCRVRRQGMMESAWFISHPLQTNYIAILYSLSGGGSMIFLRPLDTSGTFKSF
jgi:hypothetical protein